MSHHNHTLANVGPLLVFEDGLIRAPADNDGIHAQHESLVPMRFIDWVNDRQPIDTAIGAGDVAIKTGGNENGEARTHPGIINVCRTRDQGWRERPLRLIEGFQVIWDISTINTTVADGWCPIQF